VEAQPRRFPVIGEVVAALGRPAAPRRAPLGLARFGWGGEEIAVARLQVPNALLDVPLVLTAEEDGWVLTTEQGVALADGIVGREAEGRDPDGGTIHVLVTELVARPGTEFLVRKRCCARAIAAARARGR
jgi:tyrosine-protein kinase Etk/Wzc